MRTITKFKILVLVWVFLAFMWMHYGGNDWHFETKWWIQRFIIILIWLPCSTYLGRYYAIWRQEQK